jgi:hypothetical protein
MGDSQTYTLKYLTADNGEVKEDFTDLLLAQKKGRELYRKGVQNRFWIITTTVQTTVFEPRTTREMDLEKIATKEAEHQARRQAMTTNQYKGLF